MTHNIDREETPHLRRTLGRAWRKPCIKHPFEDQISCSIPDVCIDERRPPLFMARATLRELIAGLEAGATGGAAP